MKGSEAIKDIFNHIYTKATTYEEDVKLNNDREIAEKELKAFEFLAKELRVKVGVDTNNRDDVNFACLGVLIDNKLYIVDGAYENDNQEKYKQLLELSEVLKND